MIKDVIIPRLPRLPTESEDGRQGRHFLEADFRLRNFLGLAIVYAKDHLSRMSLSTLNTTSRPQPPTFVASAHVKICSLRFS